REPDQLNYLASFHLVDSTLFTSCVQLRPRFICAVASIGTSQVDQRRGSSHDRQDVRPMGSDRPQGAKQARRETTGRLTSMLAQRRGGAPPMRPARRPRAWRTTSTAALPAIAIGSVVRIARLKMKAPSSNDSIANPISRARARGMPA